MGNLPSGGGQPLETVANTAYDLTFLGLLGERLRPPEDEPASHQLVGEVKAHQGKDGSWSERMISHTGTETRPRLLREAAVGNIGQWAKA